MTAPELTELFELDLLGEGVERRYRKARPEVERMPWGTWDLSTIPEESVIAGRRAWTSAAFQEYRTGIAASLTLRALMEARAPLDLIAVFARFPVDEMVHVELCARLAAVLGGGTEIQYDPKDLCADADPSRSPLVRAAELVTRNFCVGEALSTPLLHGTAQRTKHPLPRAVLLSIARDEAAHGVFGFTFLDWALPLLSAEEKTYLAGVAEKAVNGVEQFWAEIRQSPPLPPAHAHVLGWMQQQPYLKLAARSLESRVLRPLRARGFEIKSSAAPLEESEPPPND